MNASALAGVMLGAMALCVGACDNIARGNPTTRPNGRPVTQLRVTILGDKNDPRVQPVREAIAFWNSELGRIGRSVRLETVGIRGNPVADSILSAASSQAVRGRGSDIARLKAGVKDVDADIVIALSGTDLISYGLPWSAKSKGVVVLRRSDIPPLSMPNTVRNVAAHEIGHVLGLTHNDDVASLMCGRPATCRPAAFASDSPHFFALKPHDDARLRKRWR